MVVDPDQGIVHRNLLDNDHKLQQDFGGRITVIQTVLPNIGPGALASREDAHSEASLTEDDLEQPLCTCLVLAYVGRSGCSSIVRIAYTQMMDGRTLRPSTDFYKNFALRCLDLEIAVDLFLLSTRYADLATLAEMAKFSGGTSYFYRGYDVNDEQLQQKRFEAQLADYLTRDIGFEAMLR
ncbi:unnamed protein product, partial [Toxocara canis]|uniref:Sec23_trunk domain-containing protein n=1 Tax=Toxocara canis TaxID=6265 RepID=A0A183U350_TOXCA